MHYNIAIISDLHCKYEDQKNVSASQNNLLFSNQRKNPKQHPVIALEVLLKENQITCDYLLCTGDISDQMCDQGLMSGWQYIEEIGRFLNVKEILSTVGNHDVDSFGKYNPQPYNDLTKSLGNNFPITDMDCVKNFWSENFFIKELGDYVFLVFNSAHDHYDKTRAKQSNISEELVSKIEKELHNLKDKPVHKIAMCHHHPYNFSNNNLYFRDVEIIDGGNTFLNMLEKNGFHLFIHGHKHIPRLEYFNRLPVFCSGSYSSLNNLLGKGILNTFHLLSFDEHDLHKGEITTYGFAVGSGWKEIAEEDPFFPALTGFGYRNDQINILVDQIANWYNAKDSANLPFELLLNEFPNIKYLVPSDQKQLTDILQEKHNIVIYPSFFSFHRRIISKLIS
jgi:predicted phosphodiesterase